MDIKGFVLEINDILKDYEIDKIDFGIGMAQGKVMIAKSGKAGDDQTKQDLVWIGLPVYVAVELSEMGLSPHNIWITHNVRKAIESQKHLDVVCNSEGKTKWTKCNKKLKSVGDYDVRYTSWYFNAV
jgi:class 3 adenylate cyclase